MGRGKTIQIFLPDGAEGNITNEGFVVFKGSQVTKENAPSFSSNMIKQKQNLIEDNILLPEGDFYIFTEDYLFSSCSTDGAIILGRNTNGWNQWVNNSGKTLDDVYRK
ncbi:MAG: DUF4357 domain-containing protein [Flavobacteriales bacterium]|nr:DUF4357 domain-containing protein [Flavobacteriales bacterium]